METLEREIPGNFQSRIAFVGCLLVLVLLLSLVVKSNNNDPYPWNFLSSVLGWSYFFAWSISFYPQLFLNHRRKSASGLSTDFLFYNLLGFSCYSIYNICFYASPTVQSSYKRRNNGKTNLVTLNDVFFSLHATTVTALTIAQVFLLRYDREPVSRLCFSFCAFAIVSVFVCYTAFEDVLDTLYWASYIKLAITTIKYIPQAYMNYSRESTTGWSMGNVVLDFSGGLLSLLQLLVDGSSTNNWGGIIGNPVKFGLGFVSMFFDIIFMIQHFVLFPSKRDSILTDDSGDDQEELIQRSTEDIDHA
mmetsp:Transcript_2249/g.2549  ORF Transcript_2249/g.2549 Transcript_2249/m.2549 type:complete len:304 (+) Transcript_2249:473-1384(+)